MAERLKASGFDSSNRGFNRDFRILYSRYGERTVEDAFREEDGYYSRLEEDYLAQVRKILKEEGYANSGLTLTFSRDVRGEKTYLLKIHNRRFENLDKSEIQGILERIGKVEFGAPDCRIYQEFF